MDTGAQQGSAYSQFFHLFHTQGYTAGLLSYACPAQGAQQKHAQISGAPRGEKRQLRWCLDGGCTKWGKSGVIEKLSETGQAMSKITSIRNSGEIQSEG